MVKKSFNLLIRKKIPKFKKSIFVDSDKSISIRSLLLGSISENISNISNILQSDDVISTINCLKKLGIKIINKNKVYFIYGKGIGSFSAKKNTTLNFGNSGTLARLMIGLLSTSPKISIKLTGDHSLKKRSMKKLILLMSKFGATFSPKKRFFFPIKITSSPMPIGISYKSGVSAQLKSAVMLAGLNSYGITSVIEKRLSRDHTERMLRQNKQVIKIKKNSDKIIKIFGRKTLKPLKINVAGDPSSAAFFCALTLLNKDSSIKISKVGLNPTRIGFFQILRKHGANIKFKNIKRKNGETIGDILIKYSKLSPIKASKKYYVNATDEYPILFVIAALTEGTSIFKGIKDLANKESNRIVEMQKILKQVEVKSKYKNDELKIYGKGLINASDKTIKVKNLGDHRICMSSFILAVLTGAITKIKNFDTVNTSSPSFLKIMKSLGAKFEKI